ncbi:DUF3263 domain-containing protein [Micromonospora sp. NPDC004540]|uniref:DUF3263 domain-containing protein n=1 Tax=Micromonospora sp. NPDC004540 TaxID=3154457 RepID=UPI0033BCBB65
MPADATERAATDRPEPSGTADVARGESRVTVPPPRSAPAVEATPPDDGPAMAAPEPSEGTDGLTEREQRILAFEQQWWKHAGAKEQAIRDTFGLSATRYYQLLNALLDRPAALAAEPVLVGRLRRLRSSRARNWRR